jgi:hypothetical protein
VVAKKAAYTGHWPADVGVTSRAASRSVACWGSVVPHSASSHSMIKGDTRRAKYFAPMAAAMRVFRLQVDPGLLPTPKLVPKGGRAYLASKMPLLAATRWVTWSLRVVGSPWPCGLRPTTISPFAPSGPLGVSPSPDPPAVPSGPAGVSWIPRVPCALRSLCCSS